MKPNSTGIMQLPSQDRGSDAPCTEQLDYTPDCVHGVNILAVHTAQRVPQNVTFVARR